ncbi:MAG: M20 family metallo-hydrolase [Acidimicrobiaceae bacterium]|jgi:N-carbamoyl-L-amino-acid hydrolase|nr:M20 family metallo-hydrolase [Ilumatobacteraceae bacterium]
MPTTTDLRTYSVNYPRLKQRLMDLASIGAIDGGGCARLALTDDDKFGRDLVVAWMSELGLEISIDVVGNVVGTWNVGSGTPVMTGSHIDTVRTGGKYDGNLGVLAGLEVIQTCQDNNITPQRPLAVAFYTNEEGARFAPDMFGSLVFVGGLDVETALDTIGIDGARVGDELERIGYNGATPCPAHAPHAFVELHIEQGPVLEQQNITIGAVTGVQGISWQEVTISGQSNHAGTTPMALRHDPAYVAANIAVFLRDLASRYGGNQVCTVGKIDLHPNLINVVPAKAVLTLDVRNTDEALLQKAEAEIKEHMHMLEVSEGVTITSRQLARFEPVVFDESIVSLIENLAKENNHSVMRLPSGAGHDAQMLARVCPTAMIFVPSVSGISHNPAEHTDDKDLEAGANLLLHTMLTLCTMETIA